MTTDKIDIHNYAGKLQRDLMRLMTDQSLRKDGEGKWGCEYGSFGAALREAMNKKNTTSREGRSSK